MKNSLLIVIILVLSAAGLTAQQRDVQQIWRDRFRKQVEHLLEEKVHSHQRDAMAGFDKSQAAAGSVAGETVVSASERAESEIHAAMNPTDSANIVISPIQVVKAGGSMSGGQLTLPVYVTKDFGATWTKSEFEGGGAGGGDPVLAFDADGTLYFSWLDLRMGSNFEIFMMYSVSHDGGMTWSEPGIIDEGSFTMTGGKMVDKQWMAVDLSNSPRRNTLYVSYVLMEATMSGTSMGIVVKKKAPGNASFDETVIPISDESFEIAQFSSVNVDADGNVHVFFWGVRNGVNGLWHCVSNDGETFGVVHKVAPVRFPTETGAGAQVPSHLPQRMGVMPQFEIDRFEETGGRNNLYAVWNCNDLGETGSGSFNEPVHVYFSASYDGGETWLEPRRVDDGEDLDASQFHPSISVSPSGVVVVTWYDGRLDLGNKNLEYYTAFSHDRGQTFGANIRVSGTGSDVTKQGSFGIGDYDKALSSRSYAIPIWADGRSNTGDLNVYAAFIPLSTTTGVERVLPVTSGVTLHEAVPNPATDRTTVRFSLERASSIQLALFDAAGRPVRSLSEQRYQPGSYSNTIDLATLPSGVYFVRLHTDMGYAVRRLTVTR